MAEYKTVNTDYSLEEYNPAWTEKFNEIKKIIQNVFGDKILQIEHVGSTSIIGMKAKPIIDILVIARNIDDLTNERKKMEKLGYMYKKNYITENSLFFCKELNKKRLENIHILPKRHPRIAEFIDKRDYLMTHPEEAKRYQQIKENLAKQFPNDYISYRKNKDEYLNIELVKKIKNWKQ